MLSEGRVRTRRQYREYQQRLQEEKLLAETLSATKSQLTPSGDAQFSRMSPVPTTPAQMSMFSPPPTPPPSTKRQSMLRRNTPRPPALPRLMKTAPVFGRSQSRLKKLSDPRASIVSFKPEGQAPKLSRLYSPSRCMIENYIQQCFQVMGTLGSGSFGKAIRVKSKDDGKFYAIKCTMEPFQNMSNRRLRLEEVKKHEILPEHPNLIKFICAWEEEGRLYMQTELCEKSLSDVCETEHEIPESKVWSYFIDILLAVNHLHCNDLVHVDIKPANIFVTHNGICKLGDFGLVCDERNDDVGSAVEGDSKYLAAEVLNDRPTKSADIFSLGITLLELATDMDLPKNGRYWVDLRNGNIPEEFLKNLSNDLKRVIFAMMDPCPSRRPTASDLLQNDAIQARMNSRQRRVYKQYKNGKKEFDFLSAVVDAYYWLLAMLAGFVQIFLTPLNLVYDHFHTEMCTTPAYSNSRKCAMAQCIKRTPEFPDRIAFDDSPPIQKNLRPIPFKID